MQLFDKRMRIRTKDSERKVKEELLPETKKFHPHK